MACAVISVPLSIRMCARAASRAGDDVIKHRAQLVSGARAERTGGQRFAGVLVDDVQKPYLAAVDGEVGLKVQRPHVIRVRSPHPLIPALTEPTFLAGPRWPLQSFFPPAGLVVESMHTSGEPGEYSLIMAVGREGSYPWCRTEFIAGSSSAHA